ncbi:MAG TPA: N-acetylmuramoyl-L-alanine amidase [Bryobacteraceae bacterium]
MKPGFLASGRYARFVRIGAVLLLAGAALAQGSGPQIHAVRFWSLGEVTRIAIETGGEARYQAERIDAPDRLVLDLEGVRRPAGTRGVQAIPIGDALVKQVRIAVLQPGVTRLVMDLTGPLEYSISQLTNPDRIIVELRRGGRNPAPPAHSVTGSQAVDTEPAAAPSRGPAVQVTPASLRKVEPPLAAPPKFEPKPGTPDTRAQQAAAPKPETPPAPFVPPPGKVAPPPLPEPPRMPPKKDNLDPAKTPFESAMAAKRDSQGDRSLIRTLGLKLDRIVIDAGHGGHDTGTIGPSGLMEKTLVLDVARRLGALIAQRIGSEVIFTRSDDTFIPLEERTRIANEKKADLFLSIHANSSPSPRISGSETFYLNFTTSQDALDVAARENATSQTSIHDLQNLVQKITLNEKVQESREFASIVQAVMYKGIARNRASRDRGVKKAPFVVLIGAQMPSVLAEIAFLSNARDEALLKRPEYRQRMAEALFKGVSQYASALSHFQVARQQQASSQSQ